MMMVLPPSTRWLCLLPLLFLLLLLTNDARCQPSLGEAGAFLPEDLDAGGANPGDGKVPENSSLTSASGSNAPDVASVHADAANASDSSSAGFTAVDSDLTITPTYHLPEDTTYVDFDDYLTDEAEMTTEAANVFEDEIIKRTGEMESDNNPTEGEGEPEGAISAVPQLTRRIVFSGPSVSPTAPEPSAEFTRPSSLVRGLDEPNLDMWMPNWPSELLLSSEELTRRPTIRFPTESPSSTFDSTPVPTSVLAPVSTAVPAIAPSYTVSKVPVTQYYFDLTSVAPTPVPGPLFDEEDLTSMTVSSEPSIRPDLSRQIMELSSSISELQSSALVEAAVPMSITPTLSGSRQTTVVTEPSVMASSVLLVTPVPTPALTVASSTSLDEVVESEVVDNNLDEHLNRDSGTTLVEEDQFAHDIETSGPRPPQNHPDPHDGENTTAGEVLDQAPSSGITGELPATEDSTVVTPTHTVQLEEPEEGVEEGTYEELPEKEPETVDEISQEQPPATSPPPVSSPLPPVTSPPPPLVSSYAPPPVTSPPPDPVSSTPPPPSVSSQPTPSVRRPPVTSQAPPQSVTTPRATTTTTETSTTITSPPTTDTSPVPTTPLTDSSTSSGPTKFVPSLTTTMVLPNGTMVEAPLPHIRALVTYTTMEFCRHKHNFRTMFSEWITQHLAGEALVKPKDIKFFNMATCSSSQSTQDDYMEDDMATSRREDEATDTLNMLPDEDQDETNVYFYVTSSGVMDPDLTEQFPRFPMDLEISEDITYLRPKVTQLELVRGHGATNTDLLLEEEAVAVGTSVIVIIVICSIVGVTIIVALLFFMLVKRRGATNNYYGRRCTPVSMDAYSMDSVSVYHSFRRKSKRRASGRSIKSYLNQAFDDPNGPSRPLNFAKLTHFISDIDGVHEEFGTIPVNMPKYDELPSGVEDKNRYANVIPVPETRVLLKVAKDSRSSDYINANYVRGARNESKYYIATQAPLDDTVADFWRMIWEQETRVVVMLTDFVEKGIDKCADYLPPSETLDCHRVYGEFQVTLKSRDMKEKFVVSNVQLKNLESSLVREVAHMWFTGWPAAGVPNEEAAFISFILEVRRTRKRLRAKGPIVMHCSPGTGRTGTLLACDIVMKQFENQRCIDVARTVYSIRRDRAGAVQTKEQYAFIYRVINLYASKLTSGNLDSL